MPLHAMDPDLILSSHLPAAPGALSAFTAMLKAAPDCDPFVGPDQQALEAMLATFEPDTAVPVTG